jgi:uncharacterized protein (TIGR03067 family)
MIPLLVAGSLLVGAPVPKALKQPNRDQTAILGTWRMVSHSMDGKPSDASTVCYRFEPDGKLFCVHTDTGHESPMGYALDPTGDPKRMEWRSDANGPVYPSIYKLDGDTLLWTAPTQPGGPRPTEFAPAKGVFHTEFRREPPAGK